MPEGETPRVVTEIGGSMEQVIDGIIDFEKDPDTYNRLINSYRLNTEYSSHVILVCNLCGQSEWASSSNEDKEIKFIRRGEFDNHCSRCCDVNMRHPELYDWMVGCINRHGESENRYKRTDLNKKIKTVFDKQRKLCGNSNFYIHGFDKHRVWTVIEAVLTEFGIIIVEEDKDETVD